MLKKISNIISIVFHPLIIPSLAVLIILNSGTHYSMLPFEAKRLIFYFVFIVTFLLPMFVLPAFKLMRIINDYKISQAKERIIPLLFIGVVYSIGYYFMHKFQNIPSLITSFLLASVILVFLTLLITTKWKISIHMVGIGGLTGIILVLSKFNIINFQYYILIVLLISGIVGTVRLYLNEHVPSQVYTGYFLGLAVVIITFLF